MNIKYVNDRDAKKFFITNINEIRELVESVQKQEQLTGSMRAGIGIKNQKLSFIVYSDRVETMNKEIETEITDKYFFFKLIN